MPAIGLSQPSLTFAATVAGENPAAATILVSNTGDGSLNGLTASIDCDDGGDWLSARLDGTTAPAALTVEANTSALAAGSYSATISVSSNLAANSPQTLRVSFDVAAPVPATPVIGLSRTSVSFSAACEGSDPSPQMVEVRNTGGGELNGLSVSISQDEGVEWLEASLDSTTAPAVLLLQARTGTLAAGSYSANVRVDAEDSGIDQKEVSVSFTVHPLPPRICLSLESLCFNAGSDGAAPDAALVSVTNSGGGALSGLSTTITYESGEGWLNASLDSPTAPATLTLQASIGALAAGRYSATVIVASSDADTSPRALSVSLTLAPPAPAISIAPASVSFTANANGPSPASASLSITNAGGGTLGGLSAAIIYESGTGWLEASLDSLTAPTTLTVRACTGSLTVGSYSAVVRIVSDDAENSPQAVSVSFIVEPPILVVINEIMTGTSRSASEEFVEIFNAGECAVDLANWKLVYRSAAGSTDIVLFTWTSPNSLEPGAFMVFGGASYTGTRDGKLGGSGLAASGGGVGIRNPNAVLVDSVGYGTATNAFVEGAAAPAPPHNGSIQRIPDGVDTQNNAADFTLATIPTPRGPNQ